jgi:hypothetical protein
MVKYVYSGLLTILSMLLGVREASAAAQQIGNDLSGLKH